MVKEKKDSPLYFLEVNIEEFRSKNSWCLKFANDLLLINRIEQRVGMSPLRLGYKSPIPSSLLPLSVWNFLPTHLDEAGWHVIRCPKERASGQGRGGALPTACKDLNPANSHGNELESRSLPSQLTDDYSPGLHHEWSCKRPWKCSIDTAVR